MREGKKERKAGRREKIWLMRAKALRRLLDKVKLSREKCCKFMGILTVMQHWFMYTETMSKTCFSLWNLESCQIQQIIIKMQNKSTESDWFCSLNQSPSSIALLTLYFGPLLFSSECCTLKRENPTFINCYNWYLTIISSRLISS